MASITNPKKDGSFRNQPVIREEVDTATGSVEKGFRTASFLNSGSANITVNSETLEPGDSKTYPVMPNMETYGSDIAWDATGGEVTILAIY